MPIQDFDEARQQRSQNGFKIGGETFHTRDVGFRDYAQLMEADTPEKTDEQNQQTIDFITLCIVPDDQERWAAMLARKQDQEPLTTGELLGIARVLLGQHTERPTVQPSSSGRGQVKLPTGSAAAPSSPGSTPTG